MGQADSITVTIGIPHRALSPNGRAHWRTKAKYRKAQREASHMMAALSLDLTVYAGWPNPPKWPAATIAVQWFGKTANVLRMDADNAIGSLKGAIDGLADAGLLADDRGVTWLPPVFAVDKANPRVELVVTESLKRKDGAGR